MTSSLDLARRDLQTVWHPCTQMKDHEWLPMIPIVRGEGVWLHDAVGHVELYREIYQPLLMDVVSVPTPDCYQREPGESWEAHSRRMFAHMEETLARHADTTCALTVEPLVQCAGSMRMYHSSYLALVAMARGGIEAATCD